MIVSSAERKPREWYTVTMYKDRRFYRHLWIRVRNEIMYVLSWLTVSALTRVLFLCLFPSLLRNSGNKHKITLSWALKQSSLEQIHYSLCYLSQCWPRSMSPYGAISSSYFLFVYNGTDLGFLVGPITGWSTIDSVQIIDISTLGTNAPVLKVGHLAVSSFTVSVLTTTVGAKAW